MSVLRDLRSETCHSQVFVVVRRGNLQSVGMKVHIAGKAGQFESMVIFLGVWLPEQQKSAIATAAESHDGPVTQPPQPPDDALGDSFGDQLLFQLLSFQIKQEHERFMDGTQWVCCFVKTACREPFAIGTDRCRD